MDSTQALIPFITVLAMFLANAALILPLFLWNRAEARVDIMHLDAKLESNREMIGEVHKETIELIAAIKEEMGDFHKRLCEIESKRKN